MKNLQILWASSMLLLASCFSCTTPQSQEAPAALKDELPGKWRAVNIRIEVADSTAAQVLEIDEKSLSEKPILWEFEAGNRYRSTSGAGGVQSRGIWNAFGDTLMMIEPKATYHYIVAFKGKEAIFRATLDWDGDGQENDAYEGRFVRE